MLDDGQTCEPAGLEGIEQQIEDRSAVFKKELGLKDVVLAQILIILGVSGLGIAAKVGPSSLVFWLLAILFFYLPLACIVVNLNRLMPLEGGIYQWAKLGFNEFIGFIVAWNTWLFVVLDISAIGLSAATALSYALGPRAAWLAGSKWLITLMGFALIGAMVLVAIRGLSVGKWVNNIGSIILLSVFAALIVLPLLNLSHGTLTTGPHLKLVRPALTLVNLTILVKISCYSLGGLEYIAIFAGECREPARTISRGVLLGAPLIALLSILGTGAILAFVHAEDVDLINPAAQVFSIGFRPFGLVALVAPIGILLLLARDIAQTTCIFTGGTRLPMVAGWDHLLPQWFSRLHPKYKTPTLSIIFVGAISFALGLASLIGVEQQEAYQLLESASGVFVVSGYLALFAIPLFGLRRARVRWSPFIKLAALSGLVMTVLFVVLSIFPIIEVKSWLSYGVKIAGVILGADLIGAVIFFSAERKKKLAQLS